MAKRLITSELQLNRIDAQRHVKRNGLKLASHLLLDEGITSCKVRAITYAREFVAYPASGKTFKRNQDVVDPESKTRIPWEFIKDVAIFRPGLGLFVDPEDLDVCRKTGDIVLIPRSIRVLENFIQTNVNIWVEGSADQKTMVPLAASGKFLRGLRSEDKRWFYRVPQQGVRLLVRAGDNIRSFYGGRRFVDARGMPHDVRAVTFEE